MSTADTYLLVNGQETGPFPFDHIRQGAVSGWLPADAQYRTAEDADYRPIADLVAAAAAAGEIAVAPPSPPVRPIRWRRWFIGTTIVGVLVGAVSLAVFVSSVPGETLIAGLGLGFFALLYLGAFAACMLCLYIALVWLMLPWELMHRLDAILAELRRR